MSPNLTTTPQFSTAEYARTSGSDRCKSCNQTLGSQYYTVNGVVACSYCTDQLKLRLPQDTHQNFVRGLVYGIGGAIVGLILYAAFGILTGLVIGYVSLAVGYIVGKAMMKGSKGIGGRRYQIAAVALTYAAVSMAAIPMAISQFVKQEKEKKQHLVQHTSPASIKPQQSSGTPASTTEQSSGSTAAADPSTPSAGSDPSSSINLTETAPETPKSLPAPAKPKMSFGAAVGMLALLGLASPFLEMQNPVQGIIGLIILLVGIRIAWRITAERKIDILGPFKTSSQPASAPATS